MDRAEQITATFNSLRDVVLEKNRRYGDSALSPINVFSKLSAGESIKTRLDDKISRIKNSSELRKNDCCDIVGYMVLLCIANGWIDFSELVD